MSLPDFDLAPHDFEERFKTTPDAILLDVRSPEEFGSGHLPGAINSDINSFEFLDKIAQLDPSKTYFVYCRSGARSLRASHIMHEEGFANVFHLHGGILAWHGEVEK